MLLLGGIINIFSGFVTLVWPEVFKIISHHLGDNNFEGDDFDPRSNLLLGIFSSGVIMTFGGGYLYTYFWDPQNLSLLVLGIVVRCRAFISSLYCFTKKEYLAAIIHLDRASDHAFRHSIHNVCNLTVGHSYPELIEARNSPMHLS